MAMAAQNIVLGAPLGIAFWQAAGNALDSIGPFNSRFLILAVTQTSSG